MSKRRSVILSVVLEGRTQAQTARLYWVSEGWVCKLVARWRAEGDAAFQARSRRPGSSPSKVCDETVEMVVNLRSELSAQGLDAGPLHRLPGTSNSATRSPFRHRRSGAASSIWVSWSPTPKNARSRPMSGSKPIYPTRCGSQTSPTGASPQVPTPRSLPGLMTIPATHCQSPCIGASPDRSLSTPSTKPVLTTGFPRPPSPTTPWSTPPASPAGKEAATPSKPASRP